MKVLLGLEGQGGDDGALLTCEHTYTQRTECGPACFHSFTTNNNRVLEERGGDDGALLTCELTYTQCTECVPAHFYSFATNNNHS